MSGTVGDLRAGDRRVIMKRGFPFGLSSFLIIGVVAASIEALTVHTIAADRREPILIPGVQEPEEMRVDPFLIKNVELTAPERELAEATNNFSRINLAELLPALDRILAKYPDFADGYVFRIGALCESNDRRRAISDINNAPKFMDNSRSIKDTLGALLSMRAKLAYADGDYAGAIDGLDKAIRADLKNPTQFTNSAAVKPEKTASVCAWTEPDMDTLVRRFSADYRSHMFRGLYFSKFAPLDEESLKPAIESLSKAAELNPESALPQLFKAVLLGNHFVFYKRLNKLGWGDAERDKLDAELVGEYNKALSLDPNLLPASSDWAVLRLKQRLPPEYQPVPLARDMPENDAAILIGGYRQDRAFAMSVEDNCRILQTVRTAAMIADQVLRTRVSSHWLATEGRPPSRA
jgi:tetratricopeptide (TPR) repeat protein